MKDMNLRAFLSMILLCMVLLLLASSQARATTITGLWITDNSADNQVEALTTLIPQLPYPLDPPIANGYFYCNNSGVTAVPNNNCPIPTTYSFSAGSPISRSLAASTAYQASTSSKPAVVTINLTSTASLSLSGTSTNSALVIMGSTTAVSSGSGTQIGSYTNSLSGTLVIGLSLSTSSGQTISFVLPAGWYFAVVPQSGTVTITSAFDQSLG